MYERLTLRSTLCACKCVGSAAWEREPPGCQTADSLLSDVAALRANIFPDYKNLNTECYLNSVPTSISAYNWEIIHILVTLQKEHVMSP
jgi:hypothetical protein